LTELGAWAAQYYFYLWSGLFSGTFMDAAGADPTAYRAAATLSADGTLPRICSLPTADLSIAVTDGPDPVVTGSRLTYTATVTNAGPDATPETFVQAEIPPGTRLVSASASQGTCSGSPGATAGPIGCTLGALGAGAAATVSIALDVLAPAGSTIAPTGRWTAHVTASAQDTGVSSNNNSASASTTVVAAAKPPPCPGRPGRGGVKRVGTAGRNKLVGTARGDVICGAGGNDTISGLRGNDVLRGDAGNDRIVGGAGSDKVTGGPGNDAISVRDGIRDVVSCGPGLDAVIADRRDSFGRDCEAVARR
jgi:uncharacterized repeat protein (TIGR01451 family)